MRFSFKIFLAFFLVFGFAAYLFFSSFMTELKPGFRQVSEESLVDIANLLAEIAAIEINNGQINHGNFSTAIQRFQQRELNAQIWAHTKHNVGLQVYITNLNGRVIYDSEDKHLNADFSLWNDVYKTLLGEYGARSTLSDPDNKFSSVMHVAAPVYNNGQIIGVLTVKKPNLSVEPFFQAAQKNLNQKGFILLIFALLAGLILSVWLSKSIRQLADYANTVKRGENTQPPKVYGLELTQLASAMASMKEKLEGTRYVEQYIHTLTHQLKTPIASIKGASELLTEKMPDSQRQRFINNIHTESNKLQQIVQHMLSLAEMENKQSLSSIEEIDLFALITQIIQSLSTNIQTKALHISLKPQSPTIFQGEVFLIEQALFNLIDNAISFSPKQATIFITVIQQENKIEICIEDEGSGIPDYALPHIFERFYSLPRSGENQKSTGLGLCFVKEIARLHNGSIELTNRKTQGVSARLSLHSNKE
jgi:two-component system sensor histidine kinase CreC